MSYLVDEEGKPINESNPLPTSVVGSLANVGVLVAKTISAPVAAGGFLNLSAILDVSRYKQLVVSVKPDVIHLWQAACNLYDVATAFGVGGDIILITSANQGQMISTPNNIACTGVIPYINNQDAIAHTYTFVVYGIGGQ